MGKVVHNNVLDAALNHVKSNATRLVVCSAEPTTYAMAQTNHDASSGSRLAEKTITSANYTGPAEGSTSGRKLTVDAASSMSINGVALSANATHVALVEFNSSASLGNVLYVTTCTSQSLTGGNKVNTPSWEIEIRDPA